MFFECLKSDNTAYSEWYRGIKSKMTRIIIQRSMVTATPTDLSAPPLYLDDVKACSQAYSKANTQEAAQRKFAIKSGWRCCGRTNEPSFLNYDSLKHDKNIGAPVIESIQSKSSKVKLSIFVAGVDRHSCWLLDFGDALVFDHGKNVYNNGEPCWLHPDLQSGAGSKLTAYVKAIQATGKQGALQRYAEVAIDSLPPDPTAAGLRPGACDTIAMYVPAEIAVHTTGHDLTGMSALWEYLACRLALLVPPAIVLAGWRPLPWGQLGRAPTPASYLALIEVGLSEDLLHRYVDRLFSLHDHSPPMLLRGGALRLTILHVCATLVMYYEERFAAGEMCTVLLHMRDSFTVLSMPQHDPHLVLIRWGKHLKARFDMDNLHLTAPPEPGIHVVPVVHAVKGLGGSLTELFQGLGKIFTKCGNMEDTLSKCLAGMRITPPSPSPSHAASSSHAASGSIPPAAEISPPLSTSSRAPPASPAFVPPTTPASITPMEVPGIPIHSSTSTGMAYKLTGLLASDFYLDCMKANNNLPQGMASADISRGKEALAWFNSMSTAEERGVLLARPINLGAAQRLVKHLAELIISRMVQGYRDKCLDVPKVLLKGDPQR